MYSFAGLSIFTGSIADTVRQMGQWIRQKKHAYICVTGAHGVVEAQRESDVMSAHTQAELVVPDGMPLVWMGKAVGYKNTQRIYGPDLLLAVCKEAQRREWKIFLYGTTKGTLQKLKEKLLAMFPRLYIVGEYAPPFRALTTAEDSMIVKTINKVAPQIIFVGLSTPKQELWMQKHVEKLKANTLIGVGAAFDFIAGTKKQAPSWVRRVGFEWLFRLAQEPKRLSKRYFVSNVMFISLILRHAVPAIKLKLWQR
jgi:N-acetylglucosaminyldiphosphoundecaprenol N-acetyl-beta-D-mannosaminyltransferase